MNAEAGRALPKARATRFGIVCIALAVLCMGWTWTAGTISAPNERARVFLSMALVDRGEVAIDPEIKRFGRLIDVATREGRSYSDKAPGSSFLGALPYALIKLAGVRTDELSAHALVSLQRTCVMLPISFVGGLVLYLLLLRRRLRESTALFASLLWMLATPAFHYGGAFYGHHIAAVFLLLGLYLIEHPSPSLPRSLAAGLCLGFAVLTEYQAAPASVLLGLFAVYVWRKNPRLIFAFGLGAFVCALALLAYNNAAFGSPFALSYSHVTNPAFVHNHDHGIGGIDLPKAEAVVGLLFTQRRGLFVTAPALLLMLPGLWALFRKERLVALLLGATVVCQVLIIAGYDAWWGGWSFGPRLLLPAFGVAMLLVAYGLEASPSAWAQPLIVASVLVGFVQVQAMEATLFEVPETLFNPFREVGLYGLEANLCSPSLGNYLGLASCWGVLPSVLLGLALLGAAWFRYAANLSRGHSIAAACAGLCLTALALVPLSQPSPADKQAHKFQRILPKLVDQAKR